MEFTRVKIRSVKNYMQEGFTHTEALKMRIVDVLGNLIFCDMTAEEREAEENESLLKRYDELIKELGI